MKGVHRLRGGDLEDEVPEAKAKCKINVQFVTFSYIKFRI